MVESSDLQGAVQRTQAMERIQALQAQQDELNKKRFELERDRDRAEKGKKVQDSQEAERKRVVRDRYDGDTSEKKKKQDAKPRAEGEDPSDGRPEEPGGGGKIDVRV